MVFIAAVQTVFGKFNLFTQGIQIPGKNMCGLFSYRRNSRRNLNEKKHEMNFVKVQISVNMSTESSTNTTIDVLPLSELENLRVFVEPACGHKAQEFRAKWKQFKEELQRHDMLSADASSRRIKVTEARHYQENDIPEREKRIRCSVNCESEMKALDIVTRCDIDIQFRIQQIVNASSNFSGHVCLLDDAISSLEEASNDLKMFIQTRKGTMECC